MLLAGVPRDLESNPTHPWYKKLGEGDVILLCNSTIRPQKTNK